MVELADSDPSRSEVICRKSAELPEPNKPAALHLAARRASGTARLPARKYRVAMWLVVSAPRARGFASPDTAGVPALRTAG